MGVAVSSARSLMGPSPLPGAWQTPPGMLAQCWRAACLAWLSLGAELHCRTVEFAAGSGRTP